MKGDEKEPDFLQLFLGRRELHKVVEVGHKREHAHHREGAGNTQKERYLPAGSQGRSHTVDSENGSPDHGTWTRARTER